MYTHICHPPPPGFQLTNCRDLEESPMAMVFVELDVTTRNNIVKEKYDIKKIQRIKKHVNNRYK